jgi:predicted GNAT superfamily acetyltransferase
VSGDITIRHLATQAEYEACVQLQRDTWGREFKDAVPASIQLVTQKLGGVAAGAFNGAGKLVGFVFGITGIEHGDVVHWSDMLAVRPEVRDHGVGRRLKEFQRRAVAAIGGRRIYWTFDPLVARNAHLNFNVFGVRAVEYSRDMYGENTGSDLHRGIGTDRLVVAWPVDDGDLSRRKQETAAARAAPAFQEAGVLGDAERSDSIARAALGRASHLRIAVPRDVSVIQTSDVTRASQWRMSTRAAFEAALRAGYSIQGFTTDAGNDRGYYLLKRQALSTP